MLLIMQFLQPLVISSLLGPNILLCILFSDILVLCCSLNDRLCGLVVRVYGYRSRGPGFDSRPYQFF
jgi:hypothetical protein